MVLRCHIITNIHEMIVIQTMLYIIRMSQGLSLANISKAWNETTYRHFERAGCRCRRLQDRCEKWMRWVDVITLKRRIAQRKPPPRAKKRLSNCPLPRIFPKRWLSRLNDMAEYRMRQIVSGEPTITEARVAWYWVREDCRIETSTAIKRE